MECKHQPENLARCNCTYEPCSRKGTCCLCLEYHRNMDELPACYFSVADERTYDRSVSRFLRSR